MPTFTDFFGQQYTLLTNGTFTGVDYFGQQFQFNPSTGNFVNVKLTGVLTQSSEDGIVATPGGGQALAAPLSAAKNLHRISVCATQFDSVLLPPALSGQTHTVRNDGALGANVFPNGTETINGLSASSAVFLPTGQAATFICTTSGAWSTQSLNPNGSLTAPGVQIGNGGAFGVYRVGVNIALVGAGGGVGGVQLLLATANSLQVPGGVSAPSGVGTFASLQQGVGAAVTSELPTNYYSSKLADGTSIKVFYTPG